jgi:hypothetical protein
MMAAQGIVDPIVFVSLALRSQRTWTLVAASVAIVSSATLVANFLAPVSSWAVGTAVLVWFYAMNLVILVGAWTTPAQQPPASTGYWRLFPAR